LRCSVLNLSQRGDGCPDILVGFNRRSLLVEIKDGSKKPSARVLTPDEIRFKESWKGSYALVESKAEAVAAFERFLNRPPE
jgi:hypothetical protein